MAFLAEPGVDIPVSRGEDFRVRRADSELNRGLLVSRGFKAAKRNKWRSKKKRCDLSDKLRLG